jgi:arylsulfatase A-like enzyme
MSAQKSIILVTVDCLRADHVGFMGYERPTTPFLDWLASESFVFPSAIVAGAPTYYSFPALLASRYPLALGRDIVGLAPTEPTLATALKQAGYATASFGAANPYISSRFGYERGFDVFRDFLDVEGTPLSDERMAAERINAAPGNGWASRLNREFQSARPALGPLAAIYDELYFRYCQRITPVPDSLDALRRFPSADAIVDSAIEWLASIGTSPFFLWIHLMDPHSPYYPKNEVLALMGDPPLTPFRARYLNCYWNRSDLGPQRFARRRDEVVSLYDAGIRWVDEQMARFVETLRRSERWTDCVLAFTADHGEEFLDHGGRYHPPQLTEELIHVPLLLRVPGRAKQEVAKFPFSMLNLAPTLLDAAQLPIPPEFQGESFWPQVRQGADREAVAISECVSGCTNPLRPKNRLGPRILSVRERRYKLVLHFDPAAEDLYDLEADPGEMAPLAPSAEKPIRRRLLDVARRHLQSSIGHRDLQARTQARLRELQLEWKNRANMSSPVAS